MIKKRIYERMIVEAIENPTVYEDDDRIAGTIGLFEDENNKDTLLLSYELFNDEDNEGMPTEIKIVGPNRIVKFEKEVDEVLDKNRHLLSEDAIEHIIKFKELSSYLMKSNQYLSP